MWIHEHQDWPNLIWDAAALISKLADVRYRQGRLLGRMKGLGFELTREASLSTLTNDVVKSSAIEGENLNPEEVRSSIAGRLGIDLARFIPAGQDVEGIVEIMLDATQQFSKPLTKDRLFDWHATLFPTGRNGMGKITVGGWRTTDAPMQVVSGPIGKENVHFEAPSADCLEKEMRVFLKWFEKGNDIDPVIKAGMAHLWFVTIHPFEDGNGRIGRAIGDMALARADDVQHRFYSLSSQIAAERKHYYDQLEKQQRATLDITNWLSWFLDCLDRAIANAETTLGNVLFKAQLWDTINQRPVNDRQRLIINRMLEDNFEGLMNTSKYAKLAKCSTDTALRDIQELKERGIFIQNSSGGRSTSYRLPDRRNQKYLGEKVNTKPIKLFITYSHTDTDDRERLETHLGVMEQNEEIIFWADNKILAGDKWRDEIDENLSGCDMLLYLTSADSLKSKNCNKELFNAYKNNNIKLMPIILDHCDWASHELSSFQAIPTDNGNVKPVSDWKPYSKAWLSVVNEIRKAVIDLKQKSDESAEQAFQKGHNATLLGQYEPAISLYNKAIELDPRNVGAYVSRGIVKKRLGQPQEAIDDFNKAIELDPRCADAYFTRGNTRFVLGQYPESEADLDKAIEINPQNTSAYCVRGFIKLFDGRSREAIVDFDKAIEINPQYADAYHGRGLAKKELDDPTAREDLEKAFALAEEQGLEELAQRIRRDLDKPNKK